MKPLTTLQEMLAGNKIFVPSYQRAYSWETELDDKKSPKQVNTFIEDLEDYNKSNTTSQYYFGHFLFEEIDKNLFGVVDGQQRLTTIVIFLSALFKKLEAIRPLTEAEEVIKEDMVIRRSTHRFETVDYDKQFFKDFIIEQTNVDKNGLETQSAVRIVQAFEYFNDLLENKEEDYILKMLNTISNASCTTHPVKDESEAIQMFIFQNNRGKRPSNLEIIKAQFMFNIHLYGGEEKHELIDEIKSRFEKIYKSIATIEYKMNEDDVLTYTLRVFFNSLRETNAIDKINQILAEGDPISFIKAFTNSLANSFKFLTLFFSKDEKEEYSVHSLVALGGIGIAIPFIIKAYTFDLPQNQKNQLYTVLENLVLRHRLIGTRADIISRINGVYSDFTQDNSSIDPIIERIEWLKNTNDWWWAYWNNHELEKALQGGLSHAVAKYLLWKYENFLESQGKSGYANTRFDQIESPELEHIAPQTENPEKGYDTYDEVFKNQYINCLGNYLLLSKSHNCSVGNKPFEVKRNSYISLAQQREIQSMTANNLTWTRGLIQKRKEKIINFIMNSI